MLLHITMNLIRIYVFVCHCVVLFFKFLHKDIVLLFWGKVTKTEVYLVSRHSADKVGHASSDFFLFFFFL